MGEWLVVIPVVLALAYAVFGGVEFGLPLAGVAHIHGGRAAGKRYFSLAWESTNLMLVATVAAVVGLYPQALSLMVPLVRTIWLVAIALMVVRALLVMVQYFGRLDHLVVRWFLVAVSLAIPAVLIQTITVLMTGDNVLLDHPYMTVTLGVLAVVMAVAFWSGCFYRPGAATREIARTSFWFAMLVALVGLPLAFTMDAVPVGAMGFVNQAWPLVITAVVSAACLTIPRRWRYFAASSVLVIGVGITLLLVQLPYLVQPNLRLAGEASPLAELMVAAGLVLLMLVMIPGALRLWQRVRPKA